LPQNLFKYKLTGENSMKNSFQRHLILIMKSQQSKDIVIDECEEIINPYKNYVGYDLNEN